MSSQDKVLSVLDHNWLSVYDCCDPIEYNNIDEKEEELKGCETNDDIK